MKVDVHAFHDGHRITSEFPRQGKFTPLQVGAIMCNDALKALLNLRDKLDIPIEDKPDPNLKDSNGNTTGHLLASSCDAREYTNEIYINNRKMKFFLEKTKSYLDINLQIIKLKFNYKKIFFKCFSLKVSRLKKITG